MKKSKIGIVVLLLVLAVGFAAVSTTLVLNGTAIFGTNDDDFDVIFTKSVIDGVDVSSTTISEDGKSITFETSDLAKADDESVLNFTVTNNSTQYDANVTMECIAEGTNAEYYEITNTIPSVIVAKTSENGSVTARLKKVSVNEISETFTCTITANAVERTEVGIKTYAVGELVTVVGETFNVISDNGDTISMLASFGLGLTDVKQNENPTRVPLTNGYGWDYLIGPYEIDIQQYGENSKVLLNNYVAYLQAETGNNTVSGNLITLAELKALGCTNINDDYSYNNATCVDSQYADWLVNGQEWWTRSILPGYDDGVWSVTVSGKLNSGTCTDCGAFAIRPVITISKAALA